MSKKSSSALAMLAAALCAFAATAEVLDRPSGIKIGQRMTLRPYVSFSATYDSNVGGRSSNSRGDVMWRVNPGFALNYDHENWSLNLTGYYSYNAYSESRNRNRHNQHTYGETLRWNWSNSQGAEKGWSLMLSESYHRVTMADDFALSDGRSYNADRGQFDINGGVQRRFNESWHAGVRGGYYDLEYDNDTSNSGIGSLYGWQRWTASADFGFAPSRWTDFIGMVGYHGYNQDNAGYAWDKSGSRSSHHVGRRSEGYTAQVGIGSFATERISYRLLAGWSRFDYGDASSDDGFVYTISGNWKITDTLHTMLLASIYYQPSEREQASRARVDSVSWGIAKSLVRGKLNTTLDMTYRHETIESISSSGVDYDIDVVTARLGFNYIFNRFLSFFAYGEYLRSWDSEKRANSGYCDYDRWRVTGGVRLTY